MPDPIPARDRARQVWEAQTTEINCGQLAELLGAEGIEVKRDTLLKWKQRDGWRLDVKSVAKIGRDAISALDRAVEAGADISRASPTVDAVIDQIMRATAAIGRHLEASLPDVPIRTAPHAVMFAQAMKTASEAAAILQEAAAKAAGMAARDISARDSAGNRVGAEMLPPHSNIVSAIEAFKRS